jgi:VanZ family protein
MHFGHTMDSKMEISFWRGVAILGIVAELCASSLPGKSVGIPVPWDKVVHGSAFAVLAFTLCLGSGRWRDRASWAVPLFIALFAASDEFHQSFVPGRSSDIKDWIADMTGTTLAVVAWSRARAQKG